MFKIVWSDTCTGWSDIRKNMETMSMSKLNNYIPKFNLHISEWANEISIAVENYSYFWGKILSLLHLLVATIKWLHEYREDRVGVRQVIVRRIGNDHGPEVNKTTSSLLGGYPPRTPRIHKYRPYLYWHRNLWTTPRKNQRNTGDQPKDNHTIPGIFHPIWWKIQNWVQGTRKTMETYIVVVRNTSLGSSNSYSISQKTTEIGSAPSQERREVPSHKDS